jgi:putative sigma-54 modulation protein
MNLTICGRHLDVTPPIREYVMNKLARALRHFDRVIDTQVMLSVEPLRHKAEATMRLPGKDIHCEATGENLYAAIDALADKIDRQVLKHKDKAQNHTAEPAKRQAAVTTPPIP